MKTGRKILGILLLILGAIAIWATVQGIKDEKASSSSASPTPEVLDTTVFCSKANGLNVFLPRYSRIDLVCGTMPSMKKDTDVILVAEAAFTGALQKNFSHSNICGIHVSGGKLYRGAYNDGGFVWYDGQWKFIYKTDKSEFQRAADHGGMGFAQKMIIFQGKKLPLWRHNKNIYRALCEKDGKLLIIDSQKVVPYADFVTALEKYKVTNAIYLDMGPGWNYSWYRLPNGRAKEIHHVRTIYTTNWITFYM